MRYITPIPAKYGFHRRPLSRLVRQSNRYSLALETLGVECQILHPHLAYFAWSHLRLIASGVSGKGLVSGAVAFARSAVSARTLFGGT
jgi:hypothetical protein